MSIFPIRRARNALVALVVLVCSSGCASSAGSGSVAPARAGGDIRIGAVFPLASNAGGLAGEELAGVQAAADFVNADGGIDGRRIVLDVQDLEPGTDAAGGHGQAQDRRGVRRRRGLFVGRCRSRPARPRATPASSTGRPGRWPTGSPVAACRWCSGSAPAARTWARIRRRSRRPSSPHVWPGRQPGSGSAIVAADDDYARSVADAAAATARHAGTGRRAADLRPHGPRLAGRHGPAQGGVARRGHPRLAHPRRRRLPPRDARRRRTCRRAHRLDDGRVRPRLRRRPRAGRGRRLRLGPPDRWVPAELRSIPPLGPCTTASQPPGRPAAAARAQSAPTARCPSSLESVRVRRSPARSRRARSMPARARRDCRGSRPRGPCSTTSCRRRRTRAHSTPARSRRRHGRSICRRGSLPNGAGLRFSAAPATLGQNERAAAVIWQWQAVRAYTFVWPPTYQTGQVEFVPLTR